MNHAPELAQKPPGGLPTHGRIRTARYLVEPLEAELGKPAMLLLLRVQEGLPVNVQAFGGMASCNKQMHQPCNRSARVKPFLACLGCSCPRIGAPIWRWNWAAVSPPVLSPGK